MMRTYAGKDSKTITEESDMPKKCVQIKKKKVSETVEKIEVRYVAYHQIGKDEYTTTMAALSDATKYLNDRRADVDYSTTTDITVLKKDAREEKLASNKAKLEQCLPLLLTLCARFSMTAKTKEISAHKRTAAGALKSLCDEIIAEATYVLDNGHSVTGDLMNKVVNINSLSRQVLANESKFDDSLMPDESELAVSKSKTSDKFKYSPTKKPT